ncbi:hypothetical protein AGMMS49975_21400 [Clostridia bacterium]|nr:hypothetical protein AGMMS49975_21400 [Clostridia bacterium]
MDKRRKRRRRIILLLLVFLSAIVAFVLIWQESNIRRIMQAAQIASMMLDKDNPLSEEYEANGLKLLPDQSYIYTPDNNGGGRVIGGSTGAFDFGDYPEDGRTRLKQEIMEILTEVSQKIKDNVAADFDLPPQILLGMWYTENPEAGNLLTKPEVYWLGDTKASAYTDFTLGADKVKENAYWGNGKTGQITLAGVDLSKSTPSKGSSSAIGIMQLTDVLLPEWLYNIYTPQKMTASDFAAGTQTNVKGKTGAGWVRGQWLDAKFSALKSYNVYRPHIGYVPDTVYTPAVKMLQAAKGVNVGVSGLSKQQTDEIKLAQAITAHNRGHVPNGWTAYFAEMSKEKGTLAFDVPRLVANGKLNGTANWYWQGSGNPNKDFVQATFTKYSTDSTGASHARGYALSVINNGYAIWDIWETEIKNAKKTGGGYTGGGTTSNSNQAAADEDKRHSEKSASYDNLIRNKAYPLTDTEYNTLDPRRKAIADYAYALRNGDTPYGIVWYEYAHTKLNYHNVMQQAQWAKQKLSNVDYSALTSVWTTDCADMINKILAANGLSVLGTSDTYGSDSNTMRISASEAKAGDVIWHSGHVELIVGNTGKELDIISSNGHGRRVEYRRSSYAAVQASFQIRRIKKLP